MASSAERAARPRPRLGDRLMEAGLITQAQLEEALAWQGRTGEILGQALVKLGHLAEDDLVRELCAESGITYLSPVELKADETALSAVPQPLARQYTTLPLKDEGGRLLVAMANPFDIAAVTTLERTVGRPLQVAAAGREALLQRLAECYEARPTDAGTPPPAHALRQAGGGPRGAARPDRTAGTPPSKPRGAPRAGEGGGEDASTAAQVCEEIIRRGVALGATDIHIEPQPDATIVRYRVDGLLQEGGRFPRAIHPSLISRVKLIAELNIAESRLPQDGRFRFKAEGRDIDLRISTFPTLHGEDVALRILDRGRIGLNLEDLGINTADVALFRETLTRPHGLIAVTGPTGSGKTTTLYAGLTELNRGERCIITLEDPIEYELQGIRQAQINVKAGVTFGSGLRSILRHDPDVILVGEMRDSETVQIALSAALTGHLVLTTLHTNTAAGAIPRLLDMGAEPYLLSSAIAAVLSQRLVRKLCEHCRVPVQVTDVIRQRFGLGDTVMYGPRGCAACRQTGFRGRLGIFEVLPVTEPVAARILEGCTEEDVRRLVDRPTLLDDGLRKVKAGLTSLDELLRVIAA